MATLRDYALVSLIPVVVLGGLTYQVDVSGSSQERRAPVISKNYGQPMLEFDVDGHKVSAAVSEAFYSRHAVGDILAIEVQHGRLTHRTVVHVDERANS